MYGRKANSELKQSQLEEARLGFIQFLRRKRFSPQFIASHGDDLFATAALEYSRKVAEGEEIDSPAGWLITCAWRRTKSLLEAQGRSPQIVSTDKAETIEDELGRSPEDVTLDEDRLRKVQEAVDQLTVEERRLLELAYFEGMAVREAARELHWHPSKAQRCHEAARKHLHQLLGVDSLDELEIIVGLAAYISLAEKASAPHLPAGVEAVAETVSRGAGHGWARAQDLARRLPFGGGAESPATAAIGGSAGRAAGVCATAALACLASGVVGPGVGGVNLIGGGGGASAPAPKQRNVADTPRVAPLNPRTNPAPSPPPETKPSPANGNKQRSGGGSATASAEHTKHATEAVASQSLESAAGGSETSGAPVAESSPPPSSESSASSSSSTPTQVANQQFGP
ncbi:MAG TPA: sigma-70 family RNA polymerase sigma factor [Solirubrobacterales bacterium]|jgi:RNA polymerase sigma factor (sigma-70 family)|nr:sigma-70 family RNA polymerase sigma factor [Solirubrobacterales bacterium]